MGVLEEAGYESDDDSPFARFHTGDIGVATGPANRVWVDSYAMSFGKIRPDRMGKPEKSDLRQALQAQLGVTYRHQMVFLTLCSGITDAARGG
jgi:hypothetical protein